MTFEDTFPSSTFTNRTAVITDATKTWQSLFWFGSPGTRSDASATVYLDESVTLSDGSTINPFVNSTSGLLDIQCASLGGRTAPGYTSKPYSGGVLTTLGSFRQDWGYWEIVSKAPGGLGAWPGFFLYDYDSYAANVQTGTRGEVDFYEGSGSQPNDIYSTMHNFNGGGANHQYNSTFADGTPLPDLTAAFHTIGAWLDPSGLKIYCDNKLVTSTPLTIPTGLNLTWYIVLAHDVDTSPPAWYQNSPPANYPKSWNISSVRAFRTQATTKVAGTAARILLP